MKIICIGRNYANHAKEMKSEIPEVPVFFMKPETALHKGKEYLLPDFTHNLHYEAELVFRISGLGKSIPENRAMGYADAFTVGLDLTARDLQDECKKKGLPWEIAKAFDYSAITGTWLPIEQFHPEKIFYLEKTGKVVQQSRASEMIFSVSKIISYVSRYITLKAGDLIFTGTPEGVGKTEAGDELKGFYDGKEVFHHIFK